MKASRSLRTVGIEKLLTDSLWPIVKLLTDSISAYCGTFNRLSLAHSK
jgi:hypothetical protein